MRKIAAALSATMLFVLFGCAGPRQAARDAAKPSRPAELDLLDAWVGQWQDTGEGRMAGSDKPFAIHGTGTTSWKCDKRFLVEEMNYDMGEQGKQSSIAVRTYDSHAKLFRSWYFDSDGMIGHSKMTYDGPSKTWHMQTKGHDPRTCEPTVGEMTLKCVDDKTMEWNYTEWDRLKLKKRLAMNGVSRK